MSKLIVYFTYLCDFECNNNLLTANHLSIKRKNNSTQGQKLVLPPESKETLFPVWNSSVSYFCPKVQQSVSEELLNYISVFAPPSLSLTLDPTAASPSLAISLLSDIIIKPVQKFPEKVDNFSKIVGSSSCSLRLIDTGFCTFFDNDLNEIKMFLAIVFFAVTLNWVIASLWP